jgi:hypothetical protein
LTLGQRHNTARANHFSIVLLKAFVDYLGRASCEGLTVGQSGAIAATKSNRPGSPAGTRLDYKYPMPETAQQYTQRIVANAQGQDPIKVQSATPKKLARLIKGIPPSKLRKRPAPDKWSAAEILAHLADVEIVVGWRMRSILGSPGTPIAAFDQDAWVITGHYEKRDPNESIELQRSLREANLALLKSLSPDQWKHFGQHAERGQESIEHIVRMIAGHDINHISQIERILTRKK